MATQQLRYVGTGSVVFPGWDAGDAPQPHVNMPIEIWAKIPLIPDKRIATTRTGPDGRFEVQFPEVRSGFLRDLDVILRVHQIVRTEDEEGNPCEETKVVWSKTFDINESVRTQDFGSIVLDYPPSPRGETMKADLVNHGHGRVVYESPDGGFLPQPGMLVEIWAKTPLWPDELLGSTQTDSDGRFEVSFKAAKHGLFRDLDVIIKLFNMTKRATDDGEVVQVPTDMLALEHDLDDNAKRHQFGRLIVPFPPHTDGPPLYRDGVNRATGTLRIDDGKPGANGVPLHHMRVELWAHVRHFPSRFLGVGETDDDGGFDFRFADTRFGLMKDIDVTLQVYDLERVYDSAGSAVDVPREIYRRVFDLDEGTYEHDLGTIEVPFWPYRLDYAVPRAGRLDEHELQHFTPGRQARFYAALSQMSIIVSSHLGQHEIDPRHPTLQEIQDDYPLSLTEIAEQETPGITRGDAWLTDRALNGFNPIMWMREKANPNRLHAVIRWGEFPPEESQHDLSDVDATFELRDGKLVPVEMKLLVRVATGEARWDGDPVPYHVTASDGELWEQAKHVFRCAYLLDGDVRTHWIETHLRVEQYAIAAYRQLRRSPVRQLLFPHFAEVIAANAEMERPAWGKSVNDESAFNADSLEWWAQKKSAFADWWDWRPQQPACDDHRFAKAANLYWDVLTQWVDRFFEENAAEIDEHFEEITRWSDDLVEHSVAYVPDDALPEGLEYVSTAEIDKGVQGRVEFGGELKAIRPVTTSMDPTPEGLANAKQICRYVLYHATFAHTWTHDKELEDGGEITYASLALQHGSMGPVEKVSPDEIDSTQSLFDMHLRAAVDYGFVLADENQDVPEGLKHLLRDRASEFAALGLDVASIRSRINI